MISTAIDLSTYFARLGYGGPTAPTMETLRAVVARHAATIPFENLDPLMGRTPVLTPEALEQKLLKDGRGGYCFEHNTVLKHVLEALGFSVTGLAARVLWNQPEGAITARGHMLLRVDLPEGPHMVDVGFGGLTLTGVLDLATEEAQETPHEPFRLVRKGDERHAQALLGDTWSTVYRFDLQPQVHLDYEVSNYYLATHPTSVFTHTLMAARASKEARYGLRNEAFSIRYRNGESEKRTLESVAELREVLEQYFLIQLPEGVEGALAKVLAPIG